MIERNERLQFDALSAVGYMLFYIWFLNMSYYFFNYIKGNNFFIATTIFCLLMSVFMTVLFIISIKYKYIEPSNLQLNIRGVIVSIGAGIIVFIINLLIYRLSILIFMREMRTENLLPPIALFYYQALVGPIIEEVLMRSITLKKLCQRYGNAIALMTSSLIFAVMHFNLLQSIFAFFTGVIIGVLYIKTKNISMCIIAHIINNIMAIYLFGSIFFNYKL